MAAIPEDRVRGAFARARARLALVRFIGTSSGGYDVYAVGSTADVDRAYTVTVAPDGTHRCTCRSEQRAACWHRAAVHVRRVNEQLRAEYEARMAPARAVAAPDVARGLRGADLAAIFAA